MQARGFEPLPLTRMAPKATALTTRPNLRPRVYVRSKKKYSSRESNSGPSACEADVITSYTTRTYWVPGTFYEELRGTSTAITLKSIHKRAIGLVVWFSLRVREVASSILVLPLFLFLFYSPLYYGYILGYHRWKGAQKIKLHSGGIEPPPSEMTTTWTWRLNRSAKNACFLLRALRIMLHFQD